MPEETYSIIKEGVIQATHNTELKEKIGLNEPYHFILRAANGYRFDCPESFSWDGTFSLTEATWNAPDIEIELELFNYIREHIVQQG